MPLGYSVNVFAASAQRQPLGPGIGKASAGGSATPQMDFPQGAAANDFSLGKANQAALASKSSSTGWPCP